MKNPFGHHHHEEDKEIHLLEKIEQTLEKIEKDIRPKQLSFIKIAFTKGDHMALGPVTITVGQKSTATVQGFDQNGAPFPIDLTANPVTWAIDQSTLDSSTPAADGSDAIVSLAGGVANLTATCAGFSDTETITNVAVAPVLASIKIDFSTPQ